MERKSLQAKRKWNKILVLIIILAAYGSVIITDFSLSHGLSAFPSAFVWIFSNLLVSGESLDKLPQIMDKLIETILMSIAATTTGGIVSLFLSLGGSKTTTLNRTMAAVSRFIASISRNVPIAAWALILLLSFGQNSVTGYLALFVGSVGFLTRAFIETIDEASQSAVEALRATGATYFQIIAKAVVPQCLPQLISWVLFMIETNIRSATLVGILTGTGIGYLFDLYYKSMNYSILALATISIILAVLLIEFVSNYIRKVIV